jgi:protein-disulfide isomerase
MFLEQASVRLTVSRFAVLWLILIPLRCLALTPGGPLVDDLTKMVRDNLGIPSRLPIGFSDFEDTHMTRLLYGVATIGEGKSEKKIDLYVAKDWSYVLLGERVALDTQTPDAMRTALRHHLKLEDTVPVTISPTEPSRYRFFRKAKVAIGPGMTRRLLYIPEGEPCFVVGVVLPLHAVDRLDLPSDSNPSSANGKVTIIEYIDLQCHVCARANAFLEGAILPEYGDKVRIVAKDLPGLWPQNWSKAGAVGAVCARRSGVEMGYRSSVFDRRADIKESSARTQLTALAVEAGANEPEFQACLDDPAAVDAVEQTTEEAQRLEIQSTPTFLINGRVVIGFPGPERFRHILDEELRLSADDSRCTSLCSNSLTLER